jgi:hypothetical protein
MVSVEQSVTVSDPFILMRQMHQWNPFHRSGSDRRRQTIVGLFWSKYPCFVLLPWHRLDATLGTDSAIVRCWGQQQSRNKRRAIYRRDRPAQELRHPRNVSTTTHQINMTLQSRDQ